MTLAIIIALIAFVLVSAAIAHRDGSAWVATAPPSDPDACWGCETGGYGLGARHTCGRRAGEWDRESRTRGGRP